MNIIVKKYAHFNRSMGCYVSSRADYEKKMREGDYIDYDKATELAAKAKAARTKKYDGLSSDYLSICNEAKARADRKGNFKAPDGLIKAMIDKKIVQKRDAFANMLPSKYQNKGGFNNET